LGIIPKALFYYDDFGKTPETSMLGCKKEQGHSDLVL